MLSAKYDINIIVFNPRTLQKLESCLESSLITRKNNNDKNFLLVFFLTASVIL